MDGAGKLLSQNRVDRPLALKAALAFERRGNKDQPEMAFAPFPVAAVAAMFFAFVHDLQERGREGRIELAADRFSDFTHVR